MTQRENIADRIHVKVWNSVLNSDAIIDPWANKRPSALYRVPTNMSDSIHRKVRTKLYLNVMRSVEVSVRNTIINNINHP